MEGVPVGACGGMLWLRRRIFSACNMHVVRNAVYSLIGYQLFVVCVCSCVCVCAFSFHVRDCIGYNIIDEQICPHMLACTVCM